MGKTFGVIGFYKDPNKILQAVKKVKAAGFTNIDTFSPYPIHGMDEAMGLSRSWIPWITLLMGGAGCIGALLFQRFRPRLQIRIRSLLSLPFSRVYR